MPFTIGQMILVEKLDRSFGAHFAEFAVREHDVNRKVYVLRETKIYVLQDNAFKEHPGDDHVLTIKEEDTGRYEIPILQRLEQMIADWREIFARISH